MKSIREKTGVSATGRYVRSGDFTSENPTQHENHNQEKNSRGKICVKTFVERTIIWL
jgi:hypothetical protein